MGRSWKEQGWEKLGRKGGEGEEEEAGRESHACLHVCPFGPSSKKVGKGLILPLHLTSSGPGSPPHSQKHMVSQLLPLATYLEGEDAINVGTAAPQI